MRLTFAGALVAAILFAGPVSAQSVTLNAPGGVTRVMAAGDLSALSRETISLTAHGRTHAYSGPTLASVLAAMDAPLGPALRGPALKTVVVVRAADGYGVAFSLAEIDPAMRSTRIILADREGDAAIPAEDGPLRLVVEGDSRPARSVRQVTTIEMRTLE